MTFTVTNPGASGSLYGIAFGDTLPSGVAVDNPVSETASGCGSTPTYNAPPGAASVSLAGIVVMAGTPCTISFAIIANTAGGQDTLSGAS